MVKSEEEIKMKLQTKRLILRQPTMKDLKDIVENINNIKVSGNLLVVPYPYTIKDAKWWVNHCAEKQKEKPRKSYEFNIELKSEKRIIGGVGLSHFDKYQGTATLGYWLGEKYWKNGYGTEAAAKIIDFGFNKLKLRRIDVEAYVENAASNALIRKLGFTYEGTLRKAKRSKANGKIHDGNIYGMMKEEWKEAKKRLK